MRIKRCVCRLQTPDFRISQRCFSESNKIPEPEIVKGPSLLKTRQGRLERPSPSLLHLPGLRSLPFWTRTHPKKATLVAYQEPSIQEAVYLLENNWEIIRNEYTNSKLPPSDYQTDTEHTLHKGTWEWHTYMRKGVVLDSFRNNFRQTAEILDSLPNLFRGVPFGYTFFSTLHRQTEIQPHSAPMNFRVRIHLPLILPDDSSENELGLRVGSLTRSWHEGKALVLDDAYNHQVWNNTNDQRVLLLVDLWHPDVSPEERQDVLFLFQHAQKQGWLSKEDLS